MLAIGRALMARPKLLLLDEPSMGLAPKLVAQIFSIITEINEQGTTILLVEQNATQALQRAHRAYVLEIGRVVKSADAAELLDDEAVVAAYLGGGRRATPADGSGLAEADGGEDLGERARPCRCRTGRTRRRAPTPRRSASCTRPP